MSREIMQQALCALAESKPMDSQDNAAFVRSTKAIEALIKALAQPEHPLDKKAENARELGLDYEPEQAPPHSAKGSADSAEGFGKQEQEPVAWGFISKSGAIIDCISHEQHKILAGEYDIPLYASPKREWQGLTDDEVLTTWLSPDACKVPQCDKYHYFYLAIEAKLKEKNGG